MTAAREKPETSAYEPKHKPRRDTAQRCNPRVPNLQRQVQVGLNCRTCEFKVCRMNSRPQGAQCRADQTGVAARIEQKVR